MMRQLTATRNASQHPHIFQFAAQAFCGYIRIMRWRVFALVSLGINVLLAAGWLLASRHSAGHQSSSPGSMTQDAALQNKTNVLLRRQFFSWNEVETADYPTYIANLRAIGV